ncbi:Auxin-responsive protein [Melia azedarach]|uniref:Auxin-responsive protein n=1 Tax=Melia azedarach TaxID=155640 RepID=A0ACC1XWT1_MELAZ|nr:Auxin-responsive protein [Melia azedarach]
MINSNRLIQLARKWQKMAALNHQRISVPRSGAAQTSSAASRGHFVVYTTDNLKFTIPMKFLSRSVFVELLRMSEEEFGLPSSGPITLPCDSIFMNYVMSLIKGSIPEDLEKALLTSLSTCHFSASSSISLGESHQQQPLIYSY